jgi:tRNA threonylcarbamoyl adenosine modification protein (Sua5/YciO/YrdC/YwlC family)
MFSQTAFRLAQRIFPGPYTLVLPATRSVPRTLTDHKRRTVGIRVTGHPIAQALAHGLGRPLLTSSAIPPDGGEPCRDAEEVLEAFGKFVDVVVDAPQTPAEPSTVLEVDGDEIRLLRQGQGSIDGLLEDESPRRAAR